MDPVEVQELEVEDDGSVEDVPSARELIEEQFDAAEAAAEVESPTQSTEAATGEETAARERDEQGRFKAKPEVEGAAPATETPIQPPAGAVAEQQVEAPAEQAKDRAPQSWRPEAREAWGALPAQVKAEVQRREADVQQVFERTANERKLAQAFHQVYSPYEHMIRGEGSDPITAAGYLFQTAAALRTGSEAQKAAVVADMVKNYRVDIEMLDKAIIGAPVPEGHRQGQQQPADPRVDMLFQALQQQNQQNHVDTQQAADGEVWQFASDPAHEFYNDVRETMADLIEVSDRRGIELSLDDAYNQACKLHPEINKVVSQREQAIAAGVAQKRGLRARRAASSVSGAPAGAPPQSGPVSRRQALEDAVDQHSG